MKSIKYIFSTILLLGASYMSAQNPLDFEVKYAQWSKEIPYPYYTSATVYTPKNTPVTVYKFLVGDWTQQQKNDMKNACMSLHQGITLLAEATIYYNCHAWAWTGDTTIWLSRKDIFTNVPQVTKYLTDNSYMEVPSSALATKVFYSEGIKGDHSAVTTTTANEVISKWGPAPMFKHSINNCPFYPNAYLSYYYAGILGSDNLIFSGEEYTLSYTPPSGSTINWSVSAGSPFTVSSATGTSTKLLKNSNKDGTGTLIATVGSNTYTKTISMYLVNMNGPSTLNWGTGSTYFMSTLIGVLMTPVPGASYSWWGDEGILSIIDNGSSGAAVNAPNNGWGTEMDAVNCSVTLNGVTDYFYKIVTIK